MKYLLLLLPLLLLSCTKKNPKQETKKTVTKTQSKKTRFNSNYREIEPIETVTTPVLNTKIDASKNAIYSSSLPFCWNLVADTIGRISHTSNAIANLINRDTCYKNALDQIDYETKVEIDPENRSVRGNVYFKKDLPFKFPLFKMDKGMLFKGELVQGFWVSEYDFIAKINYYHNENDFAVSLVPENDNYLITLIKKPFDKEFNLQNEINAFNEQDVYQTKERNGNFSNYHFGHNDILQIPIIEFDIKHSYNELSGTILNRPNNDTPYVLKSLTERNAFVLNEKGAQVESESEEVVEEAAEGGEPKRMIFDNNFIVLLKKRTQKHPFFSVYISTTELLVKQK